MSTVGRIREIWRYPVKSMGGEKLDRCSIGSLGIPGDRGWALRDDTLGEIRGARRMPVLMKCSARYRKPPTESEIPHVDITLPDGSTLGSDDPQVSAVLSRLVDRPVTLWPRQPASNKAHYRRAQPGAALMARLGRTAAIRRFFLTILRVTGMDADIREEMSREPGESLPDLAVHPAELLEFVSPPGTYFDAFPIHVLTTAALEAMATANSAAIWDVRRFRPNLLVETPAGASGIVENGWSNRTLAVGRMHLSCQMPTVRCGMTTHAQGELPKDPSVLRTIVRDAGQSLGIYAGIATAGDVAAGDEVELL
ncbi:MAG TPA: MOSC N-terminal beta barrel domain-containing protein [Candidatus Binatia bacterium]|jgi:hypothetical protein